MESASEETWQPIPGFDGYELSSLQRVRSWKLTGKRVGMRRDEPRVLIATPDLHGYPKVNLCVEGRESRASLHTLVLLTHVGPRPAGMQACHNNGDTSDPRPENLRWDTPANNNADKVAHGTWQGGENNPAAKLDADDVGVVDEMLACGWPQDDIARAHRVDQTLISLIKRRVKWKHIPVYAEVD